MNAMKFTKAKMGALVTPSPTKNISDEERLAWLAKASAEFVNPSRANCEKYSVILGALWPAGHGIPGPVLSQDDVRRAVDDFQAANGEKSYKDPFRRMRELQGEEGFLCIAKEGVRYQLVSKSTAVKRTPRAKLSSEDWAALRLKYGGRCAVCGRNENQVRLSQDHKIPRTRDGTNDVENWQPLCDECNNVKSTQCRGCEQNCFTCSWAFPETYPPLRVDDTNKELLIRMAGKQGIAVSDLLNSLLTDSLKRSK